MGEYQNRCKQSEIIHSLLVERTSGDAELKKDLDAYEEKLWSLAAADAGTGKRLTMSARSRRALEELEASVPAIVSGHTKKGRAKHLKTMLDTGFVLNKFPWLKAADIDWSGSWEHHSRLMASEALAVAGVSEDAGADASKAAEAEVAREKEKENAEAEAASSPRPPPASAAAAASSAALQPPRAGDSEVVGRPQAASSPSSQLELKKALVAEREADASQALAALTVMVTDDEEGQAVRAAVQGALNTKRIPMESVAGLGGAKNVLERDVLAPFQEPHKFRGIAKGQRLGMLLFGPPVRFSHPLIFATL